MKRTPLLLLLLVLGCCLSVSRVPADDDEFYPEQDVVDALVAGPEPAGVLFTVMERDEEALVWVLPRILHYTGQLRAARPQLPIAVLSHGDEMFALVRGKRSDYPEVHRDLQRLVNDYGVPFHVCGIYAAMSNVAASEFPDYVDVVPSGPAQLERYRQLEFEVVSLELTW